MRKLVTKLTVAMVIHSIFQNGGQNEIEKVKTSSEKLPFLQLLSRASMLYSKENLKRKKLAVGLQVSFDYLLLLLMHRLKLIFGFRTFCLVS